MGLRNVGYLISSINLQSALMKRYEDLLSTAHFLKPILS
jgi:hypothetical protein